MINQDNADRTDSGFASVMLAADAEAERSLGHRAGISPEIAPNTALDALAIAMADDIAHQTNADSAPAGLQPTPERVTHKMETMMRTAEDVLAFGHGNMDALVKSGQIWVSGFQDLSKQMAATAQATLDETMTSFKAFGGVKSLKDAMDLQSQFARVTMEKAMTETGRLTDASLKLAEQALAPITARVTLAVETMVKPA